MFIGLLGQGLLVRKVLGIKMHMAERTQRLIILEVSPSPLGWPPFELFPLEDCLYHVLFIAYSF
jgi:hypothetical protein